MGSGGNALDVIDYEGNRVIFTKRKLSQKVLQHPELNNKQFLKNIVRAIEHPNEVWQDQQDSKLKRCYYRKYSTTTYIKVVIWITDKPFRVVSAFETNKIKEAQYPKLKRLL